MDASLQRIVHLDLKASPFKLPFMEKIMHLFKSWGVTGLLIEWEDSFPYSDKLTEIGSQTSGPCDGLYTAEEVQMIFHMAKSIGLEVIQLIQTFSHMEFVLKHPQFMHLREVPLCPSVLCPATGEAQALVTCMIRQALDMQPDAKYIHIGGDEVWHMCVCEECEKVSGLNGTPSAIELYVRHVRLVAESLLTTRPNLRILMWDDLLRSASVELIQGYDLKSILEPIVCDYGMEALEMDVNVFQKYVSIFPTLWAGSVFKGASSSQQILVPVERYVSNQDAWVKQLPHFRKQVNIPGIVLTGWSRFDHFATICELLPLALPCLALCMQTLMTNGDVVSYKEDTLPSIAWPGQEMVDSVKKFIDLSERSHSLLRGDLVGAWMNPWQISHGYTNPLQVEGIAIAAHEFLVELEALEPIIRSSFMSITGPRTTGEWIGTNVMYLHKQLRDIYELATERANSQPGVFPIKRDFVRQ